MSSVFSYAQEVVVGGVKFTINEDEATVTGYVAEDFNGILDVENISFEGKMYPVTEVGERAFEKCATLTSVNLPVVTNVARFAFLSCTALTTLDMPAATNIGVQAFQHCISLTSVDLPAASILDDYVFNGCIGLTTVNLPVATDIERKAFDGCSALSSVSLPVATDFGTWLFDQCVALTSVSLPQATTLGSYTFFRCSALTSVDLPVVTTIGYSSFGRCFDLTSLSLPKVAPIIIDPSNGYSAFSDLDKSKITICIYAEEGEAEGYTAGNGWDGFKEIVYVGATGINPNHTTDITAFVDASGALHLLGGANDSEEVTVYDSMGALVAKSNASDLNVQLRSGIYFVRVGSKTLKVVAQ